LHESEAWFDDPTGNRVTGSQLRGILGDVVAVAISGDLDCRGTSTLDDVLFTVPAAADKECDNPVDSLESTFDDGDDGWRALGGTFIDDTPPVRDTAALTVSASGDGGWYWIAPAKFTGCPLPAYGNDVSFFLAYERRAGTGACGTNEPWISLQGRTSTIFYRFPTDPVTNGALYSIRLHESEEWFDAATGNRATSSQFRDILGEVRKLKISGDLECRGNSTLDDVRIELTQ
jgi:hypothetical protein